MDTFITEFQSLSVMVSSISEKRLVVLFTKGLEEPLRGWVKAFDLPTLVDAIKKARSMELAAPKSKFQSKSFPFFLISLRSSLPGWIMSSVKNFGGRICVIHARNLGFRVIDAMERVMLSKWKHIQLMDQILKIQNSSLIRRKVSMKRLQKGLKVIKMIGYSCPTL